MGVVRNEILLRDVSDVGRILSLGKDVIVGLVLTRSNIRWNRKPPFLGVTKERVDIEDHAAKWTESMFHNLPDSEFRFSHRHPIQIRIAEPDVRLPAIRG